jgi:hypothetical protein
MTIGYAHRNIKKKASNDSTVNHDASISNIATRLGRAVNALKFSDEIDPQVGGCPIYVFRAGANLDISIDSRVRYYDSNVTSSGFSYGVVHKKTGVPMPEREPEIQRCYVGYDIEYYPGGKVQLATGKPEHEPELISHQFYISYCGASKGVVIITSVRFTEDALLKFVAEAVPKSRLVACGMGTKKVVKKDVPVTRVYLIAHYSYAECGWLKPGRAVAHGAVRRDETKHLNPVMWLKDEISLRLDYEKAHGAMPEADKDLRFQALPIAKRNKKWVGKLPIFTKSEIETYQRFGYKLKRKSALAPAGSHHGSKYDTKPIAIEELVYTTAGGKDVFVKLVRELKDQNATEAAKKAVKAKLKVLNDSCRAELERIRRVENDDVKAGTASSSTLKLPKPVKRTLYFADSFDLLTGSLDALGETIGIRKITLAAGVIEDMRKYLQEAEQGYLEYSMRDAIVTAEALIYYAKKFWEDKRLGLKIRAAGYSTELFKRTFNSLIDEKSIAGVDGELLKHKQLLGWEYRVDWNGTTDRSDMWPSASMEAFALYYYGGWAASHAVGPRGASVYHDLKSAFPCAVAMLSCDYNYGLPYVYRGERAKEAAADLLTGGPFQIAGVCMSFRFHEKHPTTGRLVEPIFPTKIDKTRLPPMSISDADNILLFPRTGYTYVTWPEFYVAVTQRLLEGTEDDADPLKGLQIHHVVVFEKIEGKSALGAEMMKLVEERGKPGNKAFLKMLMNFYYGKSAEGVGQKTVITADGSKTQKRLPGPLTCFPIAAYTTSVCRATIGELLQKHDCYGIATDGFISPDREVAYGEIGVAIQLAIKSFVDEDATYKDVDGIKRKGWIDKDGIAHSGGKPYDYIETDFTSESGLFMKSRGYALIGSGQDSGKVKLAQMGVQVEEKDKKSEAALDEFIKKLEDGEYIKSSSKDLNSLKENGKKDDLPLRVPSIAHVRTTYDFKRVPVINTIKDSHFKYADKEYACVEFETEPLESVEDFVVLRLLARGLTEPTATKYRDLMDRFYKSGYGKAVN